MNWPEFGFIPSGGRFNPHERMLSPRNAHRLHKLWSFFTGCSGSICGGSSAAVANGVVYVGSYDGNVYALNAATGVKLWSFLTGGKVFSSPAVANGAVYVGSERPKRVRPQRRYGGRTLVIHHWLRRGLFAGGGQRGGLRRLRGRHVYALNAATGTKLWSYTTRLVVVRRRRWPTGWSTSAPRTATCTP